MSRSASQNVTHIEPFNNSAIFIQINLIFYTGLLISFNKLYTKFIDSIIYHLPVIDFLKMLLL